ncbi:hypothetical protein ACWGQ5_54045 [Streptomyces sp. NPDC055722]
MRDLLRAWRPGHGTAVIQAAGGAEVYRNTGAGRLRLILFGAAAGALDGPNGGVLPGVVGEHGGADRRCTVPVGSVVVLLWRLVDPGECRVPCAVSRKAVGAAAGVGLGSDFYGTIK